MLTSGVLFYTLIIEQMFSNGKSFVDIKRFEIRLGAFGLVNNGFGRGLQPC
ncbi:hypothetical protein ACVLD2_004611 [Paenibacillus sp. PvR052]